MAPWINNSSRWSLIFACVLLAGATSGAQEKASPQPILQKYCLECHSGKKAKGNLALDNLTSDFKPDESAVWDKVEQRLAAGTMPPRAKPQPTAEELAALRTWIDHGLVKADAARQRLEGRAVNRRLSRVEYVNTIRDLLAVDVAITDLLPADLPNSDGFENDGFALRVSSVLIERYMEAADAALKPVFVAGTRPATSKAKLSYKNERLFNLAKTEGTVVELENAVALTGEKTIGLSQFHAKTPGRYRFRVSAYAHQNDGKPLVLAVHWRSLDKGAAGSHALSYHAVPPDKASIIEFEETLPRNSTIHLSPDGLQKLPGKKGDKRPALAIEWVEVEGPLLDAWPPMSQQLLIGKLDPNKAKLADAEEALRKFIPRAFRRPASDKLVKPYLDLVRVRLEQGYNFEDALHVGLKGVLCSPHFLFLENKPGRLDDHALASRLSYFLWSSMPDQELFELAGKDKLHEPEVLRNQVERMLKDPRAAAFTENFLDQWLNLRDFDSTVPDKKLYPEFGEFLKISMLRETRLFFDEILKNDLSALNFVDSEFAMLNEPLARLYGIAGVAGPEFRKVKLPAGCHRGGVMTQASVLRVTANGITTSPVLRGVWVMKTILGQPVPPPPAEVPAIEPDTRGAVTIRAQLAKHRQSESCAACHRKIDPLGFALENFDVMGGWRENYRAIGAGKKGAKLNIKVHGRNVAYHIGPRVEAGDVMPDGQPFKNIDEFKRILLTDPDPIARCIAEKLIVYGTGSPIRPADRAIVAAIVERSRTNNYGLRTLIQEIVQSDLFRNK